LGDKADLEITWLRDESLEDVDNLPAPEVIAREIIEDLTAALAEFEKAACQLRARRPRTAGADGGREMKDPEQAQPNARRSPRARTVPALVRLLPVRAAPRVVP